MNDSVKILSARRAYEFKQDDLRLTILTTPAVQQYISQAFGFQMAQTATPMQTFGPVPQTLPPGAVFNFGTIPFPEGAATPIRYLHFEPRRVVIDVAGPSSAIDAMFAQLATMLEGVSTPDGSPVMGTPERVLNYSEITHPAPFNPSVLLAPPARDVVQDALDSSELNSSNGLMIVPSIHVGVIRASEEFHGSASIPPDLRNFVYEIRSGTRPQDRVYFSAAPLTTDAHLSYLGKVEAVMALLSDPLAIQPPLLEDHDQ
jgi:hypothetical protein